MNPAAKDHILLPFIVSRLIVLCGVLAAHLLASGPSAAPGVSSRAPWLDGLIGGDTGYYLGRLIKLPWAGEGADPWSTPMPLAPALSQINLGPLSAVPGGTRALAVASLLLSNLALAVALVGIFQLVEARRGQAVRPIGLCGCYPSPLLSSRRHIPSLYLALVVWAFVATDRDDAVGPGAVRSGRSRPDPRERGAAGLHRYRPAGRPRTPSAGYQP